MQGTKLRAHHAAVFMATVEATSQMTTAEIFVEDHAGRPVQARVIGWEDCVAATRINEPAAV